MPVYKNQKGWWHANLQTPKKVVGWEPTSSKVWLVNSLTKHEVSWSLRCNSACHQQLLCGFLSILGSNTIPGEIPTSHPWKCIFVESRLPSRGSDKPVFSKARIIIVGFWSISFQALESAFVIMTLICPIERKVTLKATSSLLLFFPFFGFSISTLQAEKFQPLQKFKLSFDVTVWCWCFMYSETVDCQNSANVNCVYHLGRRLTRSNAFQNMQKHHLGCDLSDVSACFETH